MRTSFVLHLDSLEILNELTNDQKGELLQAIVDFQRGEEVQLSQLVKIAFIPIKNQLIRDNEKYQARVNQNKANGSKGGRPKADETQNNPVGLSGNQSKAKKAENDNVNDSVNVNDTKETSQHEPSSSSRKNPSTPYQKILDCYKAHLNGKPDYNLIEVMELTKKRKAKINELWIKVGRDLQTINNYFEWLYKNRELHTWLFGQNDRGWKADIEFICRIETFVKAKEGTLGNFGGKAA